MDHPLLGRLEEFDARSRAYPVRTTIARTRPRSYHWSIDTALDQGREGACVGFAWTHELIARPVTAKGLGAGFAMEVYREAQRHDNWPGENYSGTSVLAGAKVVQMLGHIGEYRWAFGLDDLIMALSYTGPAVLGIPWYESMYDTTQRGKQQWVEVKGAKVGGHAILARGVNLRGEYVTLHNSWGEGWGTKGSARISFSDLEALLADNGEACVPVTRKKV